MKKYTEEQLNKKAKLSRPKLDQRSYKSKTFGHKVFNPRKVGHKYLVKKHHMVSVESFVWKSVVAISVVRWSIFRRSIQCGGKEMRETRPNLLQHY